MVGSENVVTEKTNYNWGEKISLPNISIFDRKSIDGHIFCHYNFIVIFLIGFDKMDSNTCGNVGESKKCIN